MLISRSSDIPHMVSEYASEIIQMIAPAMKAGVAKKHFDQAIKIHPSFRGGVLYDAVEQPVVDRLRM